MDANLAQLEKYIGIHAKVMANREDGPPRKAAATQVAFHTAQWLNSVGNDQHPQWSEMVDLLCIALNILSDSDGDSRTLAQPRSPNAPGGGGMQFEWAEMLREQLVEVLLLLNEEVLVKVRRKGSSKRYEAEQSVSLVTAEPPS